jgi:hypothetical protein
MDEELKSLMKRLGQVINEALTESPKINVAIQNIREAGYEVFLIIEASIGFNKKDKTDRELGQTSFVEKEKVRLRITPDDVKFLKSLKISIENDPH